MDQTRAGITHQCFGTFTLGAKLGLFSFFKDNKYIKHITAMIDNTTAVAYINNMGEIRSDLCDDVALDIWQWAAQ